MTKRFILLIVFLLGVTIPVFADDIDLKDLDQFMSLPYVSGYRKALPQSGVTRYDRAKAYNGINLFCTSKKAEAVLMDMKGNVLHTWNFDLKKIYQKGVIDNHPFRRVLLMEDGSIIAVFETIGLLKLDKDSKQQWFLPGQYHHDMRIGNDGNIYALSREFVTVTRNEKDFDIWESYISIITPEGKVIDKISIFRSFENSPFSGFLKHVKMFPDIFHTNTIKIFDGSLEHLSPLFKKGNITVAMRNIFTVAIIDPQRKQVVWAMNGNEEKIWHTMHDPLWLSNGHMVIFDNTGYPGGADNYSKAIEVNPFTKEIYWVYTGSAEEPFFSLKGGAVQRLPNGNTLITETDNGRSFEVVPDGTIVWEYVTPHRMGKNNDRMADLMRMQRLTPEQLPWLSLE